MLSRMFIGSYKLETILHLYCTGFNYAICCDFKENERPRSIQHYKGSTLGKGIVRIHTNWGPDPRQGYRISQLTFS